MGDKMGVAATGREAVGVCDPRSSTRSTDTDEGIARQGAKVAATRLCESARSDLGPLSQDITHLS